MAGDFSRRLQMLRRRKGKTQQIVGDSCGVSKSAISAYENGESEPTASILKNMAIYFAVSSDYLLGLSDKENF